MLHIKCKRYAKQVVPHFNFTDETHFLMLLYMKIYLTNKIVSKVDHKEDNQHTNKNTSKSR